MGDREKAATGCLSEIDRLSDLPDYLLHHIISILGTKEACRTSILSKRWVNIWSTSFILDFNPRLFENVLVVSRETSDKLVSFIEATMQRYYDQNLSIRKLGLVYTNVDTEMTGRLDRWLRIALKNQVEYLSLEIGQTSKAPDFLPSYGLPMILFSAKSLISLKCRSVRVPWCASVMLISLKSLDLSHVDIDEHMLHHIIMLCRLKKLRLNRCFGINNLSIPKCSKLELLDVARTIPSGGSIKIETSSIQHFSYCGSNEFDPRWPFNLRRASKKKLIKLYVSCIYILGDVDKLVTGLSLLKIMSFRNCISTPNIKITSLTLEELDIDLCYDLVNITLDAPHLKSFCYSSYDLQLSSITSSHSICKAYLNLTLYDLDIHSFIKINGLLSRSKCFKVLSINLHHISQVEFDMDQLSKTLSETPYEVEELKLLLSSSISENSSLIALVDGLFWSCRPTMLSISTIFGNRNAIVELFTDIKIVHGYVAFAGEGKMLEASLKTDSS